MVAQVVLSGVTFPAGTRLHTGTASQHVAGAPPGPDPASLPAAGPLEEDEETPQLMRTKSDAACVIQRRPRCRTPGETQRTRRHRFSINGHFYNHKVTSRPRRCPGP